MVSDFLLPSVRAKHTYRQSNQIIFNPPWVCTYIKGNQKMYYTPQIATTSMAIIYSLLTENQRNHILSIQPEDIEPIEYIDLDQDGFEGNNPWDSNYFLSDESKAIRLALINTLKEKTNDEGICEETLLKMDCDPFFAALQMTYANHAFYVYYSDNFFQVFDNKEIKDEFGSEIVDMLEYYQD